jgi:predicted amidohydrolase
VKLAVGQIRVDGGQPAANLVRSERAIADAAQRDAELIVLPETLDCGWTHSSAHQLAGPIPGGAACESLRAAARRSRIFVCAGIVERADDLLFNAAVLISPDGDLLLHHRKIHELDIAQDLYARGDRLAIAQTSLGAVGVMICADAFAPELCIARTLGAMGAELILSPCAWAVPIDHDQTREPYGKIWHDSYRPVAREYGMTIAGVSNVGLITDGPWAGRRCIGCSLVMGPDGTPLLQGPYGSDAEALLFVDIPGPKK